MTPATLQRLEEQTHAPKPEPICASELRQLLAERQTLLATLRRIRIRFHLRPELDQQIDQAIALAGAP